LFSNSKYKLQLYDSMKIMIVFICIYSLLKTQNSKVFIHSRLDFFLFISYKNLTPHYSTTHTYKYRYFYPLLLFFTITNKITFIFFPLGENQRKWSDDSDAMQCNVRWWNSKYDRQMKMREKFHLKSAGNRRVKKG
jgi:hypothetical protein